MADKETADLGSVFGSLFPDQTEEQKLERLSRRSERQNANLRQQIKEASAARSELAKRVAYLERLVSVLTQAFLIAGAYFAGSLVVNFWGAGDFWGILAVAIVTLAVILAFRDIRSYR